MKKLKKQYIIFAVLGLLSVLGVVFFIQSKKENDKAVVESYTTVLVRTANYSSLKKFLDLYAELKAGNEVELTSPVTGKVLRFNRLEGDPVKRGQSVVFIDRFEVGARYASAPVSSPIDGVVTRILVSEGSDVKVGTSVATVGNINMLEALIQVPEVYAPEVKVGQKVYFKTRAIPDKVFEGIITRRDLSLNTDTRSLTVRANIDNKDHMLFSGIFAESYVFIDEVVNVFVVPESALTKTREGKDAVFVNNDNKASLRPVTVSLQYRDQVAISEGIKVGEQMIVFGREFLSDGAPIKALEESENPLDDSDKEISEISDASDQKSIKNKTDDIIVLSSNDSTSQQKDIPKNNITNLQ